MALRTVGVRLVADVNRYKSEIAQAAGSTRSLVAEMGRASRAGHLDAVADQAAGMGVGLLATAGAAVKFGMDFDKQMSSVRAATHATAADMERLRTAALQAGKDTAYSATEAAQGIEELAKAGVATSAILSGGLKGALDLAAAGQLDVAEAAEIAASAMTQFKLSGGDVPHVADLLAAAAGKAQGSVHDMGMALSQGGLVAAQVGATIEDTTGTLAAFASAGLLGSDAGTSLKTMLLQLINPSGKAADLMEQYGISIYNASGGFVGMSNLAGQLHDKLAELSAQERNSALATIFGSDAIRAASILYQQGADGIQAWINKTNDAGYAAETAATKTDNLAGDVERLTGSLETLAIESSTGATSGLRILVQGADRLVGSLSAIPAPVQSAIVVIAGVGGAMLLAAAASAKMRSATADAVGQLAATGPAGTRAAKGLESAAQWAGRAAIAFAAVQTATALMGDSVDARIPVLAKNLADFGAGAEAAGEASRLFGGDLETLRYDLGTLDSGFWADLGNGVSGFIEGLTGMGNVMDESLTHARERIGAVDSALAELVQSGRGLEAASAFGRLADEAARQGVSIDELKKGLPQYQAALDAAGTAAAETASATGVAAGAIGDVGASADEAQKQIDELNKAFNELFGEQMSLDEALIESAESVTDLGAAFRRNRADTRLDTEAGQANRRAILDRIEAINNERNARIANHETMESANARYDKDIEGLRRAMRQAGFTKKQIDELTGAYKAIPDKVETEVSSTGTGPVMTRLEQLYLLQRTLATGKPMADIKKQLSRDNADFLKGYAEGGYTGPGGKYQPAGVVHAGEYVAPQESVDYYGVAAFDALRSRRIPADELRALAQYADGGLVGLPRVGGRWPFPATASMTYVMSESDARSRVTPAIPAVGATGPAIVAAVRAAFPHLRAISTYRPGARTLSGNVSYHASNRAVDYPPSRELAVWWNQHFRARTKELITPWNDLNIHNGQRHRYTGAVWRQHNFAGGNAHDHIAMANGGVIREPVVGLGLSSGRSYSFGERGPERVVPTWQQSQPAGSVTVHVQAGYVVTPQQLQDHIVSTLDTLRRQGRL